MKTFLALTLIATAALSAETIADKTATFRKMPGYFPLYWEEKQGKLWLEIDKFDTDFLYLNSLPAGMGSNDIGLDRGQVGGSRMARFERSGNKVLLVVPNVRYRAVSNSPDERRAVEDSFAKSVIWGFKVEAEDNGRVLVDATAFYLRDAHNVSTTLKNAHQGAYQDGYLFGYGHDYKQALKDLATLTGPADLLPRWAFGNWFSEYNAFSFDDYKNTLLPAFRKNKVPLDVLVADTDWKSPNSWAGWNWKRRSARRTRSTCAWARKPPCRWKAARARSRPGWRASHSPSAPRSSTACWPASGS